MIPTAPEVLVPIRCQVCGNVLALVNADRYVCKRKGREIACREVVSITCEDCGAVWVPG